MYFKEKDETNIDSEFENKKKFGFNFDFKNLNSKALLFIGGGLILLIIIIVIIVVSMSNKTPSSYILELIGDETMTIGLGEEYIELGYMAHDNNYKDHTSEVVVTNNVDTSKTGEYEIVYSIGEYSITRHVIVAEILEATYIKLLGEKDMYLEAGETYNEPGFKVYDSQDQNLTDKVSVSGSVDTSKVGTYRITYSVVNSRNITTTVQRTIIVVEKGKKPQN